MTNSQSTTKSTRKRGVTLNTELLQAVNNVDSVFRGIGIPTALHYCVNTAGVSIMTVGTMGAGKGAIKSLLSIGAAHTIDLDSVTKTDLASKLGEIQDMRVHINIEELAALSDYQRDILQTVLAKVITDRTYVSEASHISIVNCELTMFCGVQPITFTQMIAQNKAWENLTSDRFIKIMLVNGLRNSDVDRFDLTLDWYNERQTEFNNLFRIDIPTVEVEEKAIDVIHRLLMNQITGNRARIYAKKIMQSWASMNNSKKGTLALAQLFESLFGFYFKIFDTFTYREDVGANLQFKGALTSTFMAVAANQRFGYTKSDYVNMFRIDESTWRRNVAELSEMQLVDIFDVPVQTPAGKRNAQSYRLGGRVSEFFEHYTKVTTPKRKRTKK